MDREWKIIWLLSVALLVCQSVSCRSIDDILLASFQAVDDTTLFGDMNGAVVLDELDMLLTKEQKEALSTNDAEQVNTTITHQSRKKRKALKETKMAVRWPNKEIPYSIENDVFSKTEEKEIMDAIAEWMRYTCITFREYKKTDNAKIHFTNGNGCMSYVGRYGKGSQAIRLAEQCRQKGVIIHEIGHAVGFMHEHNRPDRDTHVTINYTNILPSAQDYFRKYRSNVIDTMGVPYDYASVMHYGSTFFSKSKPKKTIESKVVSTEGLMGNRHGLSFGDIVLANKMYSCNDKCSRSIQCPEDAFMDKNCKCWCRGDPVKECDVGERAPLGIIASTTKPEPTTTDDPCRDENENCVQWAARGGCKWHTRVRAACLKSCRFCGIIPTTAHIPCEDARGEDCAGMLNKCDSHTKVKINCRKTCGFCFSAHDEQFDGANNSSRDLGHRGRAGTQNGSLNFALISTILVSGIVSP